MPLFAGQLRIAVHINYGLLTVHGKCSCEFMIKNNK